LQSWSSGTDLWVSQCNSTINHPGLLEQLRAEKFDAVFGESLNWCMGGIFHLAGIDKFALAESIAYKDGMYALTQVPTASSYQMFERNFEGFPNVVDLMAANSLFFLNSDQLADFSRPSVARVIDIGGIVVSNGHGKLNKEWSAILDLRPKTIFMSFGTFVRAWAMPEEYKETIRETARALPDVTFIWKYEKPEHNASQGIPNLVETTRSPFVRLCHPLRTGQHERGKLCRYKYTSKRETAAMLNNKPFSAREIFVRNMEFLAKHGPLRQLYHYGRHLNFIQYYLLDVAFCVIGFLLVVLSVSFLASWKLILCVKRMVNVKPK
ncbi:hypothetical protein PMAYCL1PPCAC_27554, partial [Pristionchus mayeri]